MPRAACTSDRNGEHALTHAARPTRAPHGRRAAACDYALTINPSSAGVASRG